MRFVLLSKVFVKGMGYLENPMPNYLASQRVEAHVVATETNMLPFADFKCAF
jgi:hypothetical protein